MITVMSMETPASGSVLTTHLINRPKAEISPIQSPCLLGRELSRSSTWVAEGAGSHVGTELHRRSRV